MGISLILIAIGAITAAESLHREHVRYQEHQLSEALDRVQALAGGARDY